MADKKLSKAVVISNEMLAEGIYSMWIQEPDIATAAKPGQFISLYSKDGSRLLPRPISICEIEKEAGRLRLVFRVAGVGTAEFAAAKVGEEIPVLGPLGNGFFEEEPEEAILIGGGIGIPPMLALAKKLSCKKTIVLGYRDAKNFLAEEFAPYGKVVIATEDGSVGTKGNVIDAMRAEDVTGTMIYACGPTPMLRGIANYAREEGIQAQVSLEERMACGIGACLACVCTSKEKDAHSHVNNKRVCKDGPVFSIDDIEL